MGVVLPTCVGPFPEGLTLGSYRGSGSCAGQEVPPLSTPKPHRWGGQPSRLLRAGLLGMGPVSVLGACPWQRGKLP